MAPVRTLYEALAAKKKKNGDSVYVFWDVQCLNIGQNWERSFVQGLSNARVIILLISVKVALPDFTLLECSPSIINNVGIGRRKEWCCKHPG